MAGNRRGMPISRDSSNKAVYSTSLRVRRQQWEDFDKFFPEGSENRNFNGFVNDLIEEYFKQSKDEGLSSLFSTVIDKENLLLRTVTVIGTGVEGFDALICVMAWLGGAKIPPVNINPAASRIYKLFKESLRLTPAEQFIDCENIRLIGMVSKVYFEEKLKHYNIYNAFLQVIESVGIAAPQRLNLVEQINGLIDMEHVPVAGSVLFSPMLRFAIYDCWREDKFRKPPERPGWALESHVKKQLAEMNKTYEWMPP